MTTNPVLAPAADCDCPKPNGDALTCIAEQYHLSRFNAALIHGMCSCPCHRGAARQAPAKNREAYKNFGKREVLS